MDIVVQVAQFLLSLSLLIVLHEFGHFLPARLFGTRVEKFFLFFDVKFALFKKKIGETVYGIGWLPLGGYVKISGMIDESMDKEQMALPPQPYEFRSKPAWQRLIIMLGGVIVNFLIALFIYILGSAYYGDTTIAIDSLKDGFLVENPILTDVGFRTGDKIKSVDGEVFDNYTDLRNGLIVADQVTVDRDGVEMSFDLPEDFLGKLSTSDNRDLFELREPFFVGQVTDSSANKGAGLQEKDYLVAINGEELRYFDEFVEKLNTLKGQTVSTSILRDGNRIEVPLVVSNEGKLDIYRLNDLKLMEEFGYLKIVRKEYTLGESFGVGFDKFRSKFGWYGSQLKKIGNPSTGAYKGVGGFWAIFQIFPSVWSWEAFWSITAFLSIMLGVLNLLPIPALDGGHVMFLLYEMISGRKPNDKFMEYAQLVGFFLLIALLLFANGNDIYRAITK